MSKSPINLKPSLVVGWTQDGSQEVILIGDAEETLTKYKEERDLKNFVRVAWYRKLRAEKAKWTDRPANKITSIDSEAGTPTLSDPAPKKRGRPRKTEGQDA